MSVYPLHRTNKCRTFTSYLRLVRDCGGAPGAVMPRREMGGGEVHYTINNKKGGRLAYQKVIGTTPNVLYIPGLNIKWYEKGFNYSFPFSGFMSGKDGEKAEHLESHCTSLGRTFVRYDPTCIGDWFLAISWQWKELCTEDPLVPTTRNWGPEGP